MSSWPIFKISTHVLDSNRGRPVPNLPVKLYKLKNENEWVFVSEGTTNPNGRFEHAINVEISTDPPLGLYKLNFSVQQYYKSLDAKSIYPFIDLIFEVEQVEHHHMPLLLNAFGYTTYRGS